MTLAQLQQDVSLQFTTVARRFDHVEKRLDRVEARLDRVEERLDRVELRLDSLEQRLTSGFDDVKRHTSMVVESLHDDMRIFADAIRTNTERIDGHERRLRRLES